MKRPRTTLHRFFKPIDSSTSDVIDPAIPAETEIPAPNPTPDETDVAAEPPEPGETVIATRFERDPGKRVQIFDLPVDQQDEARRFYISEGPYQPMLDEYPMNDLNQRHRFKSSWYQQFNWLEYSPHTNRAYCLPCFIFSKKPIGRSGSDAFTVSGFQNWKKVNDRDECAFLKHMGKDAGSAHNFSIQCFTNLKNNMAHIDTVVVKQRENSIANARLRLKTTIDSIRWLTFQACPFRGHDESPTSLNRGNFLEMVKLLAVYNKEVKEVVLENAPGNAKYTSPDVRKEILAMIARKVQKNIREEIGNSKFCIMVDEARDESKKEQMAIVIRFVNKEGLINERFLDLVHVQDTAAVTLKNSICAVLAGNNLSVQDIRGQGYDGSSNMRGEWNGLKALILNEYPYAYYIHCMAHQLQLALVAASREVHEVHNFFQHANFIINVVSASPKRNDELLANQAAEITREIELGELDTGRGANQMGSLQRPGDTRWSSHYKSILSLKKMFGAAISVLCNIANDRSVSRYSRGDAGGALRIMMSFDFVFILFMMEKIMKITDVLCQTLQKKSIDIVNAMDSISNTKVLLHELRDEGWEPLLEQVQLFCEKHEVDIPDLNHRYVDVTKSRNKHDNTTTFHHYKMDVFNVAIDQQLSELEDRFSSQATELLDLCASLDPRGDLFDTSKICTLVEKYYPGDFSSQERAQLECQLPHYRIDVCNHPEIKMLPSLADLTYGLVKKGKVASYPMVDRLLRLVITLPVSTATTERAFSAMKLVKTRLRSKIGDDFLRDYLVVYIEKDLAAAITSEEIIDSYDLASSRKAKFKLINM